MTETFGRKNRSPKRKGLARYCLRLELLEDRTLLDTVSWNAAVSGNWSDSIKWNTGFVPRSGDLAVIDATGADNTVALDTNPTVAGLTLNSPNATLNNPGGVSLSGAAFTLQAGTLSNTGSVVLGDTSGVFTLQGGTLNNSGSFLVDTGTFNFNSGTVTGTPPVVTGGNLGSSVAHLNIGAGSTATGTLVLQGIVALTGDVQAGQTLWVQGSGRGAGNLRSDSGFMPRRLRCTDAAQSTRDEGGIGSRANIATAPAFGGQDHRLNRLAVRFAPVSRGEAEQSSRRRLC